MIDMFELGPHLPANAALLPLGFKQRLALACATLHAPAVLFLDEPTSGVDPLMRREFWHHINALTTKGVAGGRGTPLLGGGGGKGGVGKEGGFWGGRGIKKKKKKKERKDRTQIKLRD